MGGGASTHLGCVLQTCVCGGSERKACMCVYASFIHGVCVYVCA